MRMLCDFLLLLWIGASAAVKPHTIALQSREVPRGKRLARRTIGPTKVPLKDWFINTDLQWYSDIQVGEPPQNISVVFDTGSGPLEFASKACGEHCANQTQFDPALSNTFVDTGTTRNLSFFTGVGVDVVEDPADWTLTLRSATDTVSIGGLAAKNVSLYLITDQTPTFGMDPFSGIQGLAAKPQGILAALIDQGLPPLFSFFLTPKSIGNAELMLGGIDTSKFQGNLTYANLSAPGWVLNSTAIFVNGKTDSSGVLAAPQQMIFDSGTSNILLDVQTAEAIYALISPDIKEHASEPGAYGLPCSQVSSLPAVIDIAFTDVNGYPFNLTVPSEELNVGPFPDDASTCQLLVNALDGGNIIGGSLMKHYYTVHDIGNQRMGFATTGF